MYKISTERRFHELSYQFFRVCHGRCYRVHSQKMDWQALSRDKIKKVAVLQYSDLFWCGRGDSNLWPLESESNALSSWATTAHLWKSSLGRDSSYKIVKIGLVVNSWSVYREPPGNVPAFSRYAEQFLAGCLTCHSCRRTTTEWYRLTMKREFCWFCTFAAKTGKSPLLVVTTGFSDILWCCLHSSGQMVVKMQINSVRTYGKNTFNKFQKGSFNSILNIFHRRQLLFQFPGKVTRNLIFAHADRLWYVF